VSGDEYVWLRHVGLPGEDGHGAAFKCPVGAAADWKAMGWEPGDPPEEHNPVVAENLAAQQAAAEQAAADAKAAKAATKASRNSGTDTTPQEG
jgi:hypothetical protein